MADLSEMTLAELWDMLERNMDSRIIGNHWDTDHIVSIRAELKRRCERMNRYDEKVRKLDAAVAKMYEPDVPPTCPCPVVGEGRLPPAVHCPKCGKPWAQWIITHHEPCPECVLSRPTSPTGYEFTEEWDRPNGRPYLGYDGKLRWPDAPVDQDIDGGKRWILRRVEMEKPLLCPKCGKERGSWVYVVGKPCPDCENSRPTAPQGYEYTGEWRKPVAEDACWLDHNGVTVQTGIEPWGPAEHWDAGRRWILKKKAEEVHHCAKCGTGYEGSKGLPLSWICAKCWDDQPVAPSGYAHVGEWRPPKRNEHYLGANGLPYTCQQERASLGSCWILRKLDECDCPVLDGVSLHWASCPRATEENVMIRVHDREEPELTEGFFHGYHILLKRPTGGEEVASIVQRFNAWFKDMVRDQNMSGEFDGTAAKRKLEKVDIGDAHASGETVESLTRRIEALEKKNG